MDRNDSHARLLGLSEPLGHERRDLELGFATLRLGGLDAELAAALSRRWGGFLRPVADDQDPTARVRVVDAGSAGWLERWVPGEAYRIEPLGRPPRRVVASYHFAVAREDSGTSWRLAVNRSSDEPLPRVLDNALRFLASRIAVDRGGFPMHAAGVAIDGRAFMFAGPSGSGKTTAVALAAPARCLGDDFGIVLPIDGTWYAPALPFDNSECVAADAPRGLFPLGAILRLHQADSTEIVRPVGALAQASLMSTVAFPWAMPESAQSILDQVSRCVHDGHFRHLRFTRTAPLWTLLV